MRQESSFLTKNVAILLHVLVCCVSFTSAFGDIGSTDAVVAKFDCPDRVTDVAMSPDGSLLAAGYGWNKEGGVRIWRVADHSEVASLVRRTGERADIRRIAFSPDGKLFAAANWDGDVMMWVVGSWNSYKTVLSHRGSPTSLSFTPDSSKLAFSSDASLELYDVRSARTSVLARQGSKNLGGSFGGASFSPDGRVLAACRPDAIQFWDVSTRTLDRTWKSEWSGFFCQFSSNGDYLLAGGAGSRGGKSVVVWSTADGAKLRELTDFRGGVYAAVSSHSGTLFALGGGDYGGGGDLSLWTLKDGQQIGYVSVGRFPIQSIAFSPDDQTLAAGSEDGYVVLFNVGRIRGFQVKEQPSPLCGEVRVEGTHLFIVPLSKVPPPMSPEFDYAWKIEVVDSDVGLGGLAGYPVALTDWAIRSDAARDRAIVHRFLLLAPESKSAPTLANYVVLGDIQNPGWNQGFIAKVYGDGSFAVATNMGVCLAYGSLTKSNSTPDFDSLRKRLVDEGLLAIPKVPVTLGIDHYRTRFIDIAKNGVSELRSDGEVVDFSKANLYPTQKQKDFRRIFDSEEAFVTSLLHAGMTSSTK